MHSATVLFMKTRHQALTGRSNGLAVAGFAWPWASKNDPDAHDIEIDGLQLTWNRTATDWINSETSRDEVGSIHTVQGYDLNYAGVIIGSDLGYDEKSGRELVFVSEKYFRPAEVEELLGDSTKARRELGWLPEYTFDTLVQEMVDCDCGAVLT